MDILFEQLKSMVVFAQIVEQGSLSAAAKHIGLSRSVVRSAITLKSLKPT
jgi:DNA-binding transcriptional LysR family regulator